TGRGRRGGARPDRAGRDLGPVNAGPSLMRRWMLILGLGLVGGCAYDYYSDVGYGYYGGAPYYSYGYYGAPYYRRNIVVAPPNVYVTPHHAYVAPPPPYRYRF